MGKRLATVLIFAIFAVAVVVLAYILAGGGARDFPGTTPRSFVAQLTTVANPPVRGDSNGSGRLAPDASPGVTPDGRGVTATEQKQYELYAE